MSGELTVTRAMPVASMGDIEAVGKYIAGSGMFGCKNEAQGVVLAMTCHMEGITPIQFNRIYHMIDGKPSMRADAMLAEFNKRGGKHEVLRRDAEEAAVKLNGVAFSLKWDEAKKEPFVFQKDGKTLKTNWASPRARMQMLWARVVSDGVRTVMPEVAAGIYTPEETEDMKALPVAAAAEPVMAGNTQPPKVIPPEQAQVSPPRGRKPKAEPAAQPPPPQEPPQQEPSHAAEPEPSPEDLERFSRIPCGPRKGEKFSIFSTSGLKTALEKGPNYPEFEKGHLDFVRNLLAQREAEEKKEEPK